MVERLPGCGDGPVHVPLGGMRHAADDLLGVRGDDLDDIPPERIDQLPADEQFSVFDKLAHGCCLPRRGT